MPEKQKKSGTPRIMSFPEIPDHLLGYQGFSNSCKNAIPVTIN
jgi:hypothetical protein